MPGQAMFCTYPQKNHLFSPKRCPVLPSYFAISYDLCRYMTPDSIDHRKEWQEVVISMCADIEFPEVTDRFGV